ncbi:MAG: NADH-quinone oxidoreductase subunit NuoH, partial [Stellaceae bacterium]
LGPNRAGPFGLFQPLADAIKMAFKEQIIPTRARLLAYLVAPCVSIFVALVAFAVVPLGDATTWGTGPIARAWAPFVGSINVGLLYILAISSLAVYGIVLGGWSSGNRYSLLGALRSAAQMVSYEVSIGFVIVSVLLCVGSLNLSDIVEAQKTVWFALPLFPMFIVFFISGLAETNRSPFDLPEGESELVAGFFVEYSSMTFALFYLGEYANMILMSAMTSILFLGGWLAPFGVAPFTWIPGPIWFFAKIAFVLFGFLWVRATMPRYRYDQLMRLGWKVFLPLSLAWLAATAAFLVFTGMLPA